MLVAVAVAVGRRSGRQTFATRLLGRRARGASNRTADRLFASATAQPWDGGTPRRNLTWAKDFTLLKG